MTSTAIADFDTMVVGIGSRRGLHEISSAEAWPFTAGREPILFVGPRSGPS